MKPIIGINLDISTGPPAQACVQVHYFQAVHKAGGIPVLLPPIPDEDLQVLLDEIDGLVLIGGNDYSPSMYGETPCPSVELLDPVREEFDVRLARYALQRTQLPLLGICGGCQLINIVLGGSLIQDIKTALPESPVIHSSTNGHTDGWSKHDIRIEKSSILSQIYRDAKVIVPSSHHQAVKQLGQSLRATAFADDGVIEAIEHTQRNFTVGVQWHPERDFDRNKELFFQLVKQAAQRGGA